MDVRGIAAFAEMRQLSFTFLVRGDGAILGERFPTALIARVGLVGTAIASGRCASTEGRSYCSVQKREPVSFSNVLMPGIRTCSSV